MAREIPNAWAGGYADVASDVDALLWAVSWEHADAALTAVPHVERLILIDCSNPEDSDGRSLAIGFDTSGAEAIALKRKDLRVVKAFSHTYAELLRSGPRFDGARASVLLCGDDEGAKRLVSEVIECCGFDPVDCGPLKSARYLEPAAMLMVQLVRGMGLCPEDIALKVLRRRSAT